MEDIKEFLKSIGLGKNEAEIYCCLVKRGISSVLGISKETKIHRSNIYEALRNLLKKGLIYEVTKDKKKFFYARPPASLFDYLKNRELELQSVIERLESEHAKHHEESSIRISKGKFALREAIMGLLGIEQPIAVYGIPQKAPEILGPMLKEFHPARIKKGLLMRHIYNKGDVSNGEDRIKILNEMEHTEAKHLPSKYDSMVSTLICGTTVLLLIWHEEDITVIEIKNEDVAKSYQNYFEILWKSAKFA